MWKWQWPLPEISESSKPKDGLNWHINSVGLTMLRIPAGVLVRSDQRFSSNPGGCVILRYSSLLSDREVTRAQFQVFITDPDCADAEKPQDWNGADVAFSPTEQHPVQNINWNDAVLFCNWLSRREGLTPCYERIGNTERSNGVPYDAWQLTPNANGYRLPTEAEWEYACRAGTVTAFNYGEDVSLLDRYAVYGVARMELPGSKLPNGWGLFDMCGNVWEWCHDRYGSYPAQALVSDPTGPDQGPARVIRGGSIISDRKYTQSGTRTSAISQAQADGFNRQPWGANPSLWREVEAAMNKAGLDEFIPELPPTYGQRPKMIKPESPGGDPSGDGE